jgi:histidyl-tRNA synthetase
MARPETAPLGGTRDFLPVDVLRRGYVVETIERVYRSYGFEPLETPVLERLSTLLGKYGEEGDQLLYRVLKRGNALDQAIASGASQGSLADEGLRYDLTVPLARVIAEYRHQLPTIWKRYQIQPVYRADRPAKGRYREFYQCDVDIVGTPNMLAEVEVLSAATRVFEELGFVERGAFSILLNHRGMLFAVIEAARVPKGLEMSAIAALDKLDKVGPERVRSELTERGIPPESADLLLQMVEDVSEDNDDRLQALERAVGGITSGRSALAELRTLLGFAKGTPASPRLRVTPALARGLSYYTGPIYEVVIPGFSGSVAAGGRYDQLLGMFSGRDTPACGISLGLERVLVIMADRDMFPDSIARGPQVLVTQFDANTADESLRLAAELRSAGLTVDVYPDLKSYGVQFKYAEKRGIRWAMLVGPRERDAKVVTVRDLTSGEQTDVARSGIVSWVSEHTEG